MIRWRYPNLHEEQGLYDFVLFVCNLINQGWTSATRQDGLCLNNKVDEEAFIDILDQARRERDYGKIYRMVFGYLTHRAAKARWLEKTPTHVFHIPEILRCIPDAQFVEIVRDPRDILASKKTRRLAVWQSDRYRSEQKPIKHLEKAYDPLWDSLSWKSAVRAGLKAKQYFGERIFTVRYEDLVTDPESHVRKLCDFLDLEFDPDMLQISYRNPADWQKRKAHGIASDSVERWRDVLTLKELALCQWVVRAEMLKLGYALSPVPITARLGAPVVMLRSTFEFVQRLWRRYRLGGGLYLTNVLINYWKRLRKLLWR